jgi:hypothetical protein
MQAECGSDLRRSEVKERDQSELIIWSQDENRGETGIVKNLPRASGIGGNISNVVKHSP